MILLSRTMMACLILAPSLNALTFTQDPSPGPAPGIMAIAQAKSHSEGKGMHGGTVWGKIKRFTDDYVVLGNSTYRFADNVVIDTYSLRKDERGDVRLVLDDRGLVTYLFFYGIDMPDAVSRYKM